MSYSPTVKVYYISPTDVGPDENNRLVPAPKISVEQELIYANDIVIGYTPIITINGNCTSLDLRNIISGTVYDFNDTVVAIQKFKNIINANGGTFLVTDANGKELLKATGGTIRSINIEESDNRWVNYAPYTVTIDFNELWMGDCDNIVVKNCGIPYDGLTDSPNLLDMKKFRVKSFTDSFNVDLSEDTMYNSYAIPGVNMNNQHFKVKYTINATGKHYFSSDFKLMPAWEQAKRFVQYKIIEQIKNRLTQNFMKRANSGCAVIGDLASLYASASPGFISDITTSNFGFYNETISCDSSEAEGSFSATYEAIIKRKNGSSNSSVLHTISKSVNTSDDGSKRTVTININGTIQGLIEGGLLKTSNILDLPNDGAMLEYSDGATGSRFSQASGALSAIATKEDLNANIKSFFGITNAALGVTGSCIDPAGLPKPASHSIANNYTEGSITYDTSYNTDIACGSNNSFTNISVGIEYPVDVVVEFIIPGRAKGPIIQKINSKTPKKITLNIDGTVDKKCCYLLDGAAYAAICSGLPLPSGVPASAIDNMKMTQDQFVYNPIDGSYSISRAYTACCG